MGDGLDGGFLVIAEIEIVAKMVFKAHFKEWVRCFAGVNDEHYFATLFRMEVAKLRCFDAFVDLGKLTAYVDRSVAELFI